MAAAPDRELFYRLARCPTLSYASPSSRFELAVTAHMPLMDGGAACRLTDRTSSEVLWVKEFPFVVSQAVVSEDGTVAGCGVVSLRSRTQGEDGERGDYLHFVIIGPQGALIHHEVIRQEDCYYPDGPPNPTCSGLILDSHSDRVIMRLFVPDPSGGAETWRAYRPSSGDLLDVFQPARPPGPAQPTPFLVGALPVEGAPFTLVHWWRAEFRGSAQGVVCGGDFGLIDTEGRLVWLLPLQSDYALSGRSNVAQDQLHRAVWRGEIRTMWSEMACEFEVYSVAQLRRLRYVVKPTTEDGWQVEEHKYVDYVDPVLADVLAADGANGQCF